MLSRANDENAIRLRRAKSTTAVSRRPVDATLQSVASLSCDSRNNAITAATRAYERLSHATAIQGQKDPTIAVRTNSSRRLKSEGIHLARGSTLSGRRKTKQTERVNRRGCEGNPQTSPSFCPSTQTNDSSDHKITSQASSDADFSATKHPDHDYYPYPGTSAPPYVVYETSPHLLSTPPSLAMQRKRLMVHSSMLSGSGTEASADAVAFARDQYLNAHREKALSKSKSFIVESLVPRLRRGISRSFAFGDGQLHTTASVDRRLEDAVVPAPSGMSRRSFSSSFRSSLRKAFNRKTLNLSGPTAQQVTSKEAHYGRRDKSGGTNGNDQRSALENGSTFNANLFMSPCAISIRSGKSDIFKTQAYDILEKSANFHDHERSRVTSWADSSHQNTILLQDTHPLPIIREVTESRTSPAAIYRTSLSTTPTRLGKALEEGCSNRLSNEARSRNCYHIRRKEHSPDGSIDSIEYCTKLEHLEDCGSLSDTQRLSPQTITLGSEEDEAHELQTQSHLLASRNEVVSPSNYTENAMNHSTLSIASQTSLNILRYGQAGTAFISESQPFSRWSLESPSHSQTNGRVTTSNEWRRWAAHEIAGLDSVGAARSNRFGPFPRYEDEQLSSKREDGRVTSCPSVAARKKRNGGISSSSDSDEGFPVNSEEGTNFSIEVDVTESSSSRNANTRHTSQNSVIRSNVISLFPEANGQKSSESEVQQDNDVQSIDMISSANIQEQERRLSRTSQSILAAEQRDMKAKLASSSIRGSLVKTAGGLQRRAIMPWSSVDENFLMNIRRGPYASNRSSPTRASPRTGASNGRARTPISRAAGQENTPPSSRSRETMVQEFLSSRANHSYKRKSNSPAFI